MIKLDDNLYFLILKKFLNIFKKIFKIKNSLIFLNLKKIKNLLKIKNNFLTKFLFKKKKK